MRKIIRNKNKKMAIQERVVNLENSQMDINLDRDAGNIYNTKKNNDDLLRMAQKQLLPQVKGNVKYVDYMAYTHLGNKTMTTVGIIEVNKLVLLDDKLAKDNGREASFIYVRDTVQTKNKALAQITRTVKEAKKDKTNCFLPHTASPVTSNPL